MATSSSIAQMAPHLESVLGPLTASDDATIRGVLSECDERLLELAHHFDRDRAGCHGQGLGLAWSPSGQVSICGFVSAFFDGSNCVDFCVDLRPSWYYGRRAAELTWEVEAEVYADCTHPEDHRAPHRVWQRPPAAARTAVEAATSLRDAIDDLLLVARANPLAHWFEQATD